MADDPNGIQFALVAGGTAIVAVGTMIAVVRSARRRRKADLSEREREISTRLARISEVYQAAPEAAGPLFFLLFASVVCGFKYFSAETYAQQGIALLLWIGNCLFWGILTLVGVAARRRTMIVYRDQPNADRREPTF